MPRDVSEAFFDPQRVIDTLTRHGVRYVLIGGVAGRLLGSPLLTEDIDLVPDLAPANLSALAAALRELGARLPAEGVDGGVEIPLDEPTFTSPVTGFETEAGAIDVAREAIGRGGLVPSSSERSPSTSPARASRPRPSMTSSARRPGQAAPRTSPNSWCSASCLRSSPGLWLDPPPGREH